MFARIALRRMVTAATYRPMPVMQSVRAFSSAGFTLGDMVRIDTTPNHKPPSQEDTIEGRYASVLFTGASQQECLYDVMEDMMFLGEMYKNSEEFRLFTQNGGIGKE